MPDKERIGYAAIVARLQTLAKPENLPGMQRFGITGRAYGVTVPELRALAREAGRNHELALQLWTEGSREARIIASLTADPKRLTENEMEAWVKDFDNWEVCDQVCMNLFERWPGAWEKALAWSERPEEFVKRAGFVLMARLSQGTRGRSDDSYAPFFAAIAREAGDGRNGVKKGVNWALRQIGKRNAALNERAIALARELKASGSPAARWVGADALRELASETVQSRWASKQ
jgi:3-methyladenine DNA glycosylase AlkD